MVNRQPNLDQLLATLISEGAKEIEVEYDDGEWWVSVIEDNTAFGVARYTSDNEKRKVERALERLREEKSIDVDGKNYRLGFKWTDSFDGPSWLIRISGQADRPEEKRRKEAPNTIYTLSIDGVTGAYLKETFLRVVEVPADMTLGEMHVLMMDLTGFDDDHLSTFYTANQYRGRIVWLTESGEREEGHDDIEDGPLWDILLEDIYPLPKHKKLYYWFDFGDDWIFEIRRKGKGKPAVAGVEYPRVIHEEGPVPEQYRTDEEE